MVLAYQVNSKYRLRIAEYPEVEEISRVSVRAFASQPFIREIFPYGDKYPEEELRSRIYTTRQRFLKDNYIVWVVEDTEAKRITGFSIWAKLNGDKPVNPNYGFLTQCESHLELLRQKVMNFFFKNKAEKPGVFQSMVGSMADAKMKRLDGRPCWFLHVLGVDPDYQRQGLGRILVNAGMEFAEKEGCPTYLEATKEGMRLYSQLGWEVISRIHMTGDVYAPVMSWTPPGTEMLPKDEDVSF